MSHYENYKDGVAVIGMAGRFPGAASVDELWLDLRQGREGITFFTADELLRQGLPPELVHDPRYVRAHGVLRGAELFDARFFGLTPREAELMDPQHRLFLECAWEALEDGGCAGTPGEESVGVWAGASFNSYFLRHVYPRLGGLDPGDAWTAMITNDKDFLATRASYLFNLRGPSLTVQTACSTSLVAVATACQALADYQCDLALAGGVSISLPQESGYLYQEGMILSPDGHCRAFDARAGGTLGGNGVGVVLLRRLEEALAHRDPIRAVIRGWAVNNDGAQKVGYTAPSEGGQAEVIAAAQALAEVSPDSIGYVEAHGTATPLGDPIEVGALTRAFRAGTERRGFCALGSVKTNLGHLDAAAGVAGMIKTVLALEHREIPPSLHFEQPNPRIDFEASPFYVNRALAEWPAGPTPRRAGVSSFGIGGTNAHLVLEEAPAPPAAAAALPLEPRLLALSARTPAALERAAARLAEHLAGHPELPLADVAYTLALGRRAWEHRRAVVARDAGEVVAALRGGAEVRPRAQVLDHGPEAADRTRGAPEVAFLFPGQGSRLAGLGGELYAGEPRFRLEVDRCAELLLPRLGLDLRPLLFPAPGGEDEAARRLGETALAQPALFTMEHSLARLWMAWGVEPSGMLGHSVGELVAACLAGVFTLEDALALVVERGRLMQARPEGAMLAVSLPEAELAPLLARGLDLAAVNGPALCVVAGPEPAVAAAAEELTARGVAYRRLHTAHAFHSAAMDAAVPAFEAAVAAVPRRPPRRPWISNLSGTWITAEEAMSPAYWARHLRRPVRFADGLVELCREPRRALLEVGPGRVLCALARRHPALDASRLVLPSLPQEPGREPEQAGVLASLGRLWLAGVEIDWRAVFGEGRRPRAHRVRLPTYPFDRQRYWLEPAAAPASEVTPRAAAEGRPAGEPRPVEARPLADWLYAPSWQQRPLPGAARSAVAAVARAVLILAESDSPEGLGGHLASSLAELGWAVSRAFAGDRFARLGEGCYSLDPRQPEHYRRLLLDLREPPGEVLHLWSLEPPTGAVAQRDDEEVLDRGFSSLLFLAQALGERPAGAEVTLRFWTSHGQRVSGEEPIVPAQAAAVGLLRSLAAESPSIRWQAVDLIPPESGPASARLAEQLLAELAQTPEGGAAEPLVAYRGPYRWVRGWLPLEGPPATAAGSPGAPPRLRQRGVYLVTGGLGGIGLALAEHLAETVEARLVLIGRSASRDEAGADAAAALARMEARGAEVLVRRADVTDRAAMAALVAEIRERHGGFHGVIHAAGVPGGTLVQRLSPAAAAEVLAPKLAGTRVLDELFRDEPLDFMVLCSSLTAELGGPGQAAYAAANTALDAYAQSRLGMDGRLTVAIAWDAWRDAGMAVAARSAASARRRPPGEAVAHPLLDLRVASGERDVYLTYLDPARQWVVGEHRLDGRPVLPGTAFLELARAVFAHATGAERVEIRDLLLSRPLVADDGSELEVRTTLGPAAEGRDFVVESRDGDGWREHARGRVLAAAPRPAARFDLAELRRQCPREQPRANGDHLGFGPRWRTVRRTLWTGEGRCLSRVEVATEFAAELATFELHPAVLDEAFAFPRGGGLYLPFAYERLTQLAPLPPTMWSDIRFRGHGGDDGLLTVDLRLLDSEGRELAEVAGLSVKRLGEPLAAVNGHHAPRPAAADGIGRNQGAQVFARALAAGLPQVLVSTVDWAERRRRIGEGSLERLVESLPSRVTHDRPALATPYVAPRSELEATVAGLWREVLGVETIGVEDRFLDLGGHSLLATQVLSRLRGALAVDLPIRSFFEAETVAELARAVTAHRASHAGEAAPFARIQEGTL